MPVNSGQAGPSGQGAGNTSSSSRQFDGASNTVPTSATPSSFSFEPGSIFDWASSHQTQQQHQQPQRNNNSSYYPHPGQAPAHSLELVNALGSGGGGVSSGNNNNTIHPSSTQNIHNNNNNNIQIGNGQNNDDDDEDEDEDDNGSGEGTSRPKAVSGRKRVRGSGITHRLNRKGGGRPRDFIWAYFEGEWGYKELS